MTVQWVTRKDLGWPALSKNTNTDQGMIAHYDGSRGLLASWAREGHAACIKYWRRVRAGHMNGNGWRDVGYAYFVCPDRKVFEGRGVDRIQAAESPTAGKRQGGNTRYVAVTFGTGPGEMPTDGQLQAWHDLRDWLMKSHGVKADVFDHSDFTATSCAGDAIRTIERTKLKIRPGKPELPSEVEEDLVAKALPVLSKGMESYDILTLRALLFERFLSERYDPTLTAEEENNEDYLRFWGWLRNKKFDDDLEKDVVEYQKWRFPSQTKEHDGIVGPKTWGQLWRTSPPEE
jgi:hypothetical protein